MRDTCHHCMKNESVASLLIVEETLVFLDDKVSGNKPGHRVYPVCQACFDAIRIGHELPHVAMPPDWAELVQPIYSESNTFETNDIAEVRKRYGPRPGDKE